jgi:hypothetical protein
MGSSSEDFRSLQALLRLKRYEQPPPRYFNEFSGNVIARIRAGEARAQRSWWEFFGFDVRPAITFGAAAIACAMLLTTVGFGFENDAAQAGLVAGAALAASAPIEKDSTTDLLAAADADPVSTKPVMNTDETDAVAQSAPKSLWKPSHMTSPWRAGFQPVSFNPGRN